MGSCYFTFEFQDEQKNVLASIYFLLLADGRAHLLSSHKTYVKQKQKQQKH